MNRYKKLINNSIVFTIGSFGSRLISFLMVPLYTHLLSTSEYGTVDLMNTTIGFLIPFLTLELGQAALRFAIDTKTEIEKNKIFSNITTYTIIITILCLLLLPLLYYLKLLESYSLLFVILLVLKISNNLYSQYIRGIGLIKEFAVNGILMTIVTVISNIVFLIYLEMKVEGYILSMVFAALISNIYIFFSANGFQRIKFYNPDKILLKEMLNFSVPIIPNSAMWWIINSSTRIFILYFIGAAGNGIYAVANKIPAVISMTTGIFSQAWQLASFEEFESDDNNEFYSKVFNTYSVFLMIAGSAVLVIIKPLLSILVEESFYESWKIAPLLIFAVIYQSFSSFLGTVYNASKETKGSFYTSIYSGVISLISSSILIPTMGLMGAGLSTTISFFSMFIIRLKDTQKFVTIRLNKSIFILSNVMSILQFIILFFMDGILLVIIEFFLFLGVLIINKNTLNSFLKIFTNKLIKSI